MKIEDDGRASQTKIGAFEFGTGSENSTDALLRTEYSTFCLRSAAMVCSDKSGLILTASSKVYVVKTGSRYFPVDLASYFKVQGKSTAFSRLLNLLTEYSLEK